MLYTHAWRQHCACCRMSPCGRVGCDLLEVTLLCLCSLVRFLAVRRAIHYCVVVSLSATQGVRALRPCRGLLPRIVVVFLRLRLPLLRLGSSLVLGHRHVVVLLLLQSRVHWLGCWGMYRCLMLLRRVVHCRCCGCSWGLAAVLCLVALGSRTQLHSTSSACSPRLLCHAFE